MISRAMTLKDAEKIVREYGLALARECDGTAFCASRLPDSPERIIQAMKLWLAHDIQNRSLTKNFRCMIGAVATRLPFFVEDEEARRLNSINQKSSPVEHAAPTTPNFVPPPKPVRALREWTTNAGITGSTLRRDLDDFITIVEKFDPADSRYWQRVYALTGLEFPARKRRSLQG
jgi:hypothetical protein